MSTAWLVVFAVLLAAILLQILAVAAHLARIERSLRGIAVTLAVAWQQQTDDEQ